MKNGQNKRKTMNECFSFYRMNKEKCKNQKLFEKRAKSD